MQKTSSSKVMSTKALAGAKGGKTKMFGKSGVQPAVAGVSAPPRQPAFDKNMIKGGPANRGTVQGHAAPAQPGKMSVGSRSGNNNFRPDC